MNHLLHVSSSLNCRHETMAPKSQEMGYKEHSAYQDYPRMWFGELSAAVAVDNAAVHLWDVEH